MNTTLYIYTLKTTIFKQKTNKQTNTISKWRSNKRFLARVISILVKFEKKIPKEFINKFSVIVEEHEYCKNQIWILFILIYFIYLFIYLFIYFLFLFF